MKKWLSVFIACALLGAFLILSSEVHEANSGQVELIASLDQAVLRFFTHLRIPQLNSLAIDLTAMGSGIVLFILVGSCCLFLSIFKRKFFLVFQLLGVSVGAAFLTWILKFYFERSRPEPSLRLVDVQGFSYPSGHSLASAAIYFSIALILQKSVTETWEKSCIFIFFLGLIGLIGTTRIYLGVHYFSDVLAGILLGIAWASLVEFFVDLKFAKGKLA